MPEDRRKTADQMMRVVMDIDPDVIASGSGSRWPGMTYEQGVDNALRWAAGESDDDPMED